MKSIITLLFFTFNILIGYPQQEQTDEKILTGKIMVTKDGLGINNSIKLSKGTSMDFNFDGKSLDVSIGTQFYEDVELSAGFAIKPKGETCFYMTLTDGIDLGAFQFKTTIDTKSNATLNTEFKTNMSLGSEFCVNWLDNKPIKLSPSIGNPQNLVSIPRTVKSLLSFLHNLEFSSDFQLQSSFTGEDKALTYSDKHEIPLDTYCLDWEKEVPLANSTYEISKEPIDLDLSFIENAYILNDDMIQDEIWLQKFKANPSETYLNQVSIVKNKKIDVKYGVITFLNEKEIYLFKNEEVFTKVKTELFGDENISEYITIFQLENREIALSLLDKKTLGKLKELELISFEYINKTLNNK